MKGEAECDLVDFRIFGDPRERCNAGHHYGDQQKKGKLFL